MITESSFVIDDYLILPQGRCILGPFRTDDSMFSKVVRQILMNDRFYDSLVIIYHYHYHVMDKYNTIFVL